MGEASVAREASSHRRRVLVTGAAGMLGRAVVEAFAVDHAVQPLHRADCDLTDDERTRRVITKHAPHIIVHCAAWTDVDACEGDPERAMRENGDATRHVAEAAHDVDAALCYVSTDYVFDGSKPFPYLEDDPTAPINAYGRSKRAGEEHVLDRVPRSWVVRSSWLFGPGGRNFVRTMSDLLRTREEVRVVSDQNGSPTYTLDLALCLRALTATETFGVFHCTNAGACSWYEFARAIATHVQSACRVMPCRSDEFPRPAARPANSVLANRRYDGAGLPPRRTWDEALRAYMRIAGDGDV